MHQDTLDSLITAEKWDRIQWCLHNKLDSNERYIIESVFALRGNTPSVPTMARVVGVSVGKVRVIQRRAITKLQDLLA